MNAMAGIKLPDRTQTLIPGVHMKLKRALFAAALLALPGMAHAELSFLTSSTTARTEIFNIAGFPNMAVGTLVDLGSLVTSHSGTVTFTYLGQESGYTNSLQFPASGASLFESDAVGTAISAMVNSVGAINFRFTELVSPSNSSAVNGGIWAPNTSIGMIGRNISVLGNSYDYVLGYNDSAGSASLGDWDDFVVGVNFATQAPEPEVYGMMLAGLGILGWAGRRRKQLAAT
jgi:hypothetical protein